MNFMIMDEKNKNGWDFYKIQAHRQLRTCKLSSFSLQQLLFTLYSLKYTLSLVVN